MTNLLMPKSSLMPQASLHTTICNGQRRTFCFFHTAKASNSGTKWCPVLSRNTGKAAKKELSQKQSPDGKAVIYRLIFGSLCFLILIDHRVIRRHNCVTFSYILKWLKNTSELSGVHKNLQRTLYCWNLVWTYFSFFF